METKITRTGLLAARLAPVLQIEDADVTEEAVRDALVRAKGWTVEAAETDIREGGLIASALSLLKGGMNEAKASADRIKHAALSQTYEDLRSYLGEDNPVFRDGREDDILPSVMTEDVEMWVSPKEEAAAVVARKEEKEKERAASVMKKINGMIENGSDPFAIREELEALVQTVAPTPPAIQSSAQMADIVADTLSYIDKMQQLGPGEYMGVATGLAELDYLLGGLQSDRLIVLAGRPAMGKSALAMTIAFNVAVTQGIPTVLFEIEMTHRQTTQRLMQICSGISGTRIKDRALNDSDWSRLTAAGQAIAEGQLVLEDDYYVEDICEKVRRYVKENGTRLVIVDTIQRTETRGSRGDRVADMNRITKALANLKNELHISIIAVSQINRGNESRSDKRPLMSDLKESGSIEQDADIVILMYRDDYYDPSSPDRGTVELIVAKNRDGDTRTLRMAWIPSLTRVCDIIDV